MRCWRWPAGGVLAESRVDPRAPSYHHLHRYALVRSYHPQFFSDSELFHTQGYRVLDGRFEETWSVEVQRPFRLETTPRGTVADGLEPLPDDTVTDDEVAAHARLRDLVEQAYTAFAGVPRPRHVAGCPHCRPPEAGRALVERPLRLVAAEDLEPYLFSAITTWGTAEDLRYFTPRVLELVAGNGLRYPDLEIVFGKLRLAGWTGWPEAEREAVAALLEQYWTLTLARHPGPEPVATVLCALGTALQDVRPLLRSWEESLDSPAALAHLAELAECVPALRDGRRLPNAFWDGRPDQARQVVDWLPAR